MRLAALVTAGCLIGVQSAIAAGTIYYGSRTGMVVDVVSMSGWDTAQSVIHTRHTRPNAMVFLAELESSPDRVDMLEEVNQRRR